LAIPGIEPAMSRLKFYSRYNCVLSKTSRRK
jgi:hypothetical protein